MSCSIHSDREHVGSCSDCNRLLCSECMDRYTPPTCIHCMAIWSKKQTGYFTKMIIASITLGIIGILLTMDSNFGYMLVGFLWFAGIPWGWHALTKITPKVFLFLPLVGWVIYFAIKFIIALFIGFIAAPFQIAKLIKNIKLAKTACS